MFVSFMKVFLFVLLVVSSRAQEYCISPSDCQEFFVCGRNEIYRCPDEQAFNPYIQACDFPENVPGCGELPPGWIYKQYCLH